MYAISGKILLEKKDYMIIALEMMVSGKFVGICSRSHTIEGVVMQILEDYCVDHLASTQAFLDIVSPP
jgi:hypothetical protein